MGSREHGAGGRSGHGGRAPWLQGDFLQKVTKGGKMVASATSSDGEEDGGWKMGDGRWEMEDGRWKAGERRLDHGRVLDGISRIFWDPFNFGTLCLLRCLRLSRICTEGNEGNEGGGARER